MAVEAKHFRTSRLGPAANESDAEKLKSLDDMTINADTIQEKVLEKILTENADTEYLKRFHLDGATDKKTFKAKVPTVRYEDIKPDIQRIADGDKSPILTSHPVLQLLTSSGTSAGECKLIPVTKVDFQLRAALYAIFRPIINIYVPGLDKGKGLYFYFVKSETRTRGGLPAMPAFTSLLKSNAFRSRFHDPDNIVTSPIDAMMCMDLFQSMYVQMLCGLYQRLEVLRIGSVFASSLLRVIKFLEVHWEDLAHDIATGTLNDKITDETVRGGVVSGIVKPDLMLAEFIRKECGSGNWEGIVTRIWPNTKYLDTIVTGPMVQYVPRLEYYSGGIPMVSAFYGSSECFFGVNLRPLCQPAEVSYTFIPNLAYFEFIPHVSDAADKVELVDLKDVEVGKEYEVVVTTNSGLYRYQVGDIIRATGFHNATPQFQFVRRKNVLLSIETDKTDEIELHNAIQHASELLKDYTTNVVEYTSCIDSSTIPAHYVIYWELTSNEPSMWNPEEGVIEKCCLAMEEMLSSEYRQGRVEIKSIGPLEIRVVVKGAFEELMDQALSRGASFNQYKVPKCVSSKQVTDLLNSKVVSRHISKTIPKWDPSRRGSV